MSTNSTTFVNGENKQNFSISNQMNVDNQMNENVLYGMKSNQNNQLPMQAQQNWVRIYFFNQIEFILKRLDVNSM